MRKSPLWPRNGSSDSVDEDPPLSPDTVFAVFNQLSDNDQRVLWDALRGAAGPADSDTLASALERLDVGFRNADIPGGGEFEWPT